MNYKLKTITEPPFIIKQELIQEVNKIEKRLFTWVVDTREKQVIEALVKLGWIPPPPLHPGRTQ